MSGRSKETDFGERLENKIQKLIFDREKATSNQIKIKFPETQPKPENFEIITDETQLKHVSSDAAHYPGGHTPELVRLFPDAGEAEVAYILQSYSKIIPIGAQTSLTGGATPMGEVILDMTQRNKILNIGEDRITVQTGISLYRMQEVLKKYNLYYRPGPTYDGATVGGMIATNAAGAETFAGGPTRSSVEGLKVVLAGGEVLEITRGQCFAHPDGYFELKGAAGIRRIPVPAYKMPDVPKISAGYFARPEMDLIDLFIGSEGTLGVITEATLRVVPKPEKSWALVSCESEEQALELAKLLRDESLKTRAAKDPAGIDTCAIEYMDPRSVELLREDSKVRAQIKPPDNAAALLLIQLEVNSERDTQMERFAYVLDSFDLLDRTQLADEHGDSTEINKIEKFKAMRGAVPDGVNRRIAEYKRISGDERITKTAADWVVPFEYQPEVIRLYRERFRGKGLDAIVWGHISDGNEHSQIIPRSSEEVELAKQIILECGEIVIALGGSPMAEHGVGRNPVKQKLLEKLYGQEGIDQMRKVKEALDPDWKLSPGILFARFRT